MTTHFKLARADLKRPCALGLLVPKLEAQPEVAGILGHAAEGIHGAVGISGAVVF